MLSRPIRLMNRPPSRYVLHTLPSYNPHPALPHTWKTTVLYNLFGLHFHPWRPPAATILPSYGPFSWFLLLLGCNQTSLRRLGYRRIRGQSFRPIKQRYRQPLTTITIHIHHKSFHFWSIPPSQQWRQMSRLKKDVLLLSRRINSTISWALQASRISRLKQDWNYWTWK